MPIECSLRALFTDLFVLVIEILVYFEVDYTT